MCFGQICWDKGGGGIFYESLYFFIDALKVFLQFKIQSFCAFVFLISGEDMPSTVVTPPHPLLLMKRNLRGGEARVVAGQ